MKISVNPATVECKANTTVDTAHSNFTAKSATVTIASGLNTDKK